MTSQSDWIKDELLVLEAQGGDIDAFAALVDRWQPSLWRHAWRLIGDKDAAYDVVQEAWLAMVRGLGRLDDAARFRAWAYAIVSHKCRDWIRRQSRRRGLRNSLEEFLRGSHDEADRARQRCENLREALSCLSGADRAILSLRYDEQFTTPEIADILLVPEGTVKSRLHHARNRLRDLLEQ
ncbi:MAG: sigma-70 family RNA polymerase sigma factor [Pirellulales bacterium]|nr:sigma-70 family RNA polymerase sigma factor [Pirellulales bacterium]